MSELVNTTRGGARSLVLLKITHAYMDKFLKLICFILFLRIERLRADCPQIDLRAICPFHRYYMAR